MPLLVEIFHDRDTGRLPTAAVHAGLMTVAEVIEDSIVITNATRLIKVANQEADRIVESRINWPLFKANLSLVLTNKPIYGIKGTEIVVGPRAEASIEPHYVELGGSAMTESGVALLSLRSGDEVSKAALASHEVGHLLGLVKNTGLSPEATHCPSYNCVMHEGWLYDKVQTVDTSTAAKRLRAMVGRPAISSVMQLAGTDFCDDCRVELRQGYLDQQPEFTLQTMANFDKL